MEEKLNLDLVKKSEVEKEISNEEQTFQKMKLSDQRTMSFGQIFVEKEKQDLPKKENELEIIE